MKIGIISDTHTKVGRAIKAIDFLVSEDVKFIIHAGDVVRIEILEYLESLKNIGYVAVIGNNDNHLIDFAKKFKLVQEPHYFELDSLKFKIMHHPFFLVPDVDIVVYGHTHISEIDYKNRTLFINSGETCARDTNRSEVVILNIFENRYVLEQCFRNLKEENWNRKRIEYTK
jgi:hypothetical protein